MYNCIIMLAASRRKHKLFCLVSVCLSHLMYTQIDSPWGGTNMITRVKYTCYIAYMSQLIMPTLKFIKMQHNRNIHCVHKNRSH